MNYCNTSRHFSNYESKLGKRSPSDGAYWSRWRPQLITRDTDHGRHRYGKEEEGRIVGLLALLRIQAAALPTLLWSMS
ncbi:hypothetical protein HPP92_027330 [Vanilla planifolia]|uniref:Uncharacterized protein n=1 Tax=Vanilla planifolia TaxID=51239 RepID=A0A835U5K1_VANPL|nr:hypothetical protein HPP92_027330 [Vanilla planifolia]